MIEGSDDEFQLRVNVTESNGFWDDTIFLQYRGPRLLEDDIIEFVGEVYGLITYESIFGQDITIPAIVSMSSRRLRLEDKSTLASTPQPTTAPTFGIRENPVPTGEVAVYPDWEISVTSFNSNANGVIASENQFNDPPEPGHVYVLAWVQTMYTGSSIGSAWLDLDFYLVGDSNVFHEKAWVVTPDPLDEQPDALPGGTVSGNIAFMVPTDEVNSMLLVATDGGLRYADTIGYFSLK